jgi:hypothetical protein
MSKYSPEELERRRQLMIRLNQEGKTCPFEGRNKDGSFRRRGDPKPSVHLVSKPTLSVDKPIDELDLTSLAERAARLFRKTHPQTTRYASGPNPGMRYL